MNARALTEALDVMRELGSLHATLPLFASTGLVDTFKQLALHHVRLRPPHALGSCTASHTLMLISLLLRSSKQNVTPGLTPKSTTKQADVLASSGCVASSALLPHPESCKILRQ